MNSVLEFTIIPPVSQQSKSAGHTHRAPNTDLDSLSKRLFYCKMVFSQVIAYKTFVDCTFHQYIAFNTMCCFTTELHPLQCGQPKWADQDNTSI